MRAHPLLVVAVAAVAVVATVIWQKTRSPAYKATAQVLVTPVNNGGLYVGLPILVESSNFPSRTLQTATSVLKSPAAAQATAARMGDHWTRTKVTEAIEVQPLGESNIVSVTGTAHVASQAAKLANTYTSSALALHVAQLVGEAKSEIGQLQASRESARTGEESQTAAQLTALASVAAGRDPNFTLLQAATPPTSPSGSSTKLLALLALIAGLIIGIGAATSIDYLNRRVRDEGEILSIYPLPILSRIPVLPRGTREANSFQLISPRVREAFRTLQVQLPLDSPTRSRAVMFTSASPRDGKTSSAIDFALVLASAGFSVILLDLDLRKPEIGERFGEYSPSDGTADASLHTLLVDVPSAPNLRIVSPRPAGDMRSFIDSVSRHLSDFLKEARKAADYVIVDTPPLGQVSDALRVGTVVEDTIVLVTRTGNTNREELKRTRELLDRMSLPPAGLLVIGETATSDIYAEYGEGMYGKAIDPPTSTPSARLVIESSGDSMRERSHLRS